MSTFWLQFIIQEAIGVATAFIGVSSLKPNLKSALENLVQAGNQVVVAIQSGN